jgi:hypothetical protein
MVQKRQTARDVERNMGGQFIPNSIFECRDNENMKMSFMMLGYSAEI